MDSFQMDQRPHSYLNVRWVCFWLIQNRTQRVFCLGKFLVVLYYDYILTLPREIEFLWPPHNKQGWFTMACLLNRYIPIVGYLPSVVSYFISLDIHVRSSFISSTGTWRPAVVCTWEQRASGRQNTHLIAVARVYMETTLYGWLWSCKLT